MGEMFVTQVELENFLLLTRDILNFTISDGQKVAN